MKTFKQLREGIQLSEILNPATNSISDYIHDFIKSDNPRFAGKSKQERRKMAIGAYYSATNK